MMKKFFFLVQCMMLIGIGTFTSCSSDSNGDGDGSTLGKAQYVYPGDSLKVEYASSVAVRVFVGKGIQKYYNTSAEWTTADPLIATVAAGGRSTSGDSVFVVGNLKTSLYEKRSTQIRVTVKNGDDTRTLTENIYVVNPAPKAKPQGSTTISVKGISLKMVKVAGGTFEMGVDENPEEVFFPDLGSYLWLGHYPSDEQPKHTVTVSDFLMGETEVTQELWTAVMGENPASHVNLVDNQGNHGQLRNLRLAPQLPVERVSWDDCQKFIERLKELTGYTFRLPSEAEWEFAAKGGNKSEGHLYAGSDDVDYIGWCYENTVLSYKELRISYDPETNISDTTATPRTASFSQEVKQKSSNELGLYDMTGNVAEWCQDLYNANFYSTTDNAKDPVYLDGRGSTRVVRGSDFKTEERKEKNLDLDYQLRITRRGSMKQTSKSDTIGLRLAM